MLRVRLICVVLFIGLALSSSSVLAWGVAGHKIVAMVAWLNLDHATRTKIAGALRHHPRFRQDFQISQHVRNQGQKAQDRWIFQQAAIWPDIARGGSFHRGSWHYIHLPIHLTATDRESVADITLPNLRRDWKPGQGQSGLNVMQALERCKQLLSNPGTSDSDRALLLSWVLHLVGDLHQPLHSSALFSRNRFTEGDRGGNLIRDSSHGKLHSIWDGNVGLRNNASAAAILNKARSHLSEAGLRALGERAARSRNIENWLRQSQVLAVKHGYTAAVLKAVYRKGSGRYDREITITLPRGYIDTVREISDQRVVEAGFRLAEVMKSLP